MSYGSDEPVVGTAVQLQVLAGDEAGLRRAQKGAGIAEFSGLAQPVGGNTRCHLRPGLLVADAFERHGQFRHLLLGCR